MKKPFLLLTGILSMILFGCDNGHDDENYKSIVLKTTGYVEAPPDEAGIVVNLKCVDKDIQKAKACLIERTKSLNEDLTRRGIERSDILTTRVNLQKDYIWRNNSSVFNGYAASTSMNVRIRNLEILDELYTDMLDNEQLTLGPLSYHHSATDSLYGAAYLNALESASKIADTILSRLPEKNKVISRISNVELTTQDQGEMVMRFKSAEASDNGGALTVNTGNIRIEQTLFVEYTIY